MLTLQYQSLRSTLAQKTLKSPAADSPIAKRRFLGGLSSPATKRLGGRLSVDIAVELFRYAKRFCFLTKAVRKF
jgi:hypothetical protein